MNGSVVLFRRDTKRLGGRAFAAIAERLGLDAKAQRTDEAFAAHDGSRALAYAQPCARLAGLLFYADETSAWAEPVKKTLTSARARRWAESFLRESDLLPGEVEGSELEFELATQETDAVVFDGKERRRESVTTDVVSQIRLDGIEVTGPRAKVRMVFKAEDRPVLMHVALWGGLSRYEERVLVREHEVVSAIRDKLADRRDCNARNARLVDLRLVYWGDEFSGAPDLLVPWYFAEIELTDPEYTGKEPIQGPRQVMRVPAFR